ncbi:protein LCHN [Lingula anatina]|uniref:DENN domain-containing protein 11 n=1 Tax=Lingula anatina TaxID=7574 RepID=A0A1S3I636_LINAN|nr:protein LCHN [Lingula anatina]|eukprot:XP_013392834.1 protein LCHN [Lingula anatina]
MAEERTPLLNFDDESTDFQDPRQKIRSLYKRDNHLGVLSTQDEGLIRISPTNSEQNLTEVDHIVSVFVVAFDTKAGNVIEWCLPQEMDLEGVEFKSMPSGSHHLLKDFVYFRKAEFYGLACFENMPVESQIERGARMKSVGILSTSYTLLYRHMQLLETQVRHQLETPGRYSQLEAFYEDKKAVLPPSGSAGSLRNLTSTPASTPSSDILPELKITHPAGCFSQFIKFFGEQIFVLWKFALLQKRIIFFSPPPIGVVCYRVYCACCLANHSSDLRISSHEVEPYFYINVADIDSLESEVSFIACTTEKIFQSKTQLYDVYVDNQDVTTHVPGLQELLRVSPADKDKMAKLNNQRSAQLFFVEGLGEQTAMEEEEVFTLFFTEQNNRIFQTLLDVSVSMDRTLTSDHMRSMGLDPIGDRPFLMELVEMYGIDVVLMIDNPCCPK